MASTLQLPDGRTLGYAEYGDPAGVPVMHFHGTPGSRLISAMFDEPAKAAGVRVIAPERPGFGLSTLQPGRTFGDWPEDVTALADHLGLERFAVAGTSGGGSYVLACARYIPERLTQAVVLAGMAPAPRALRRTMRLQNRAFFWLAASAPWLAEKVMTAINSRADKEVSEAMIRRATKSMAPDDQRIALREDLREMATRDLPEAGRNGQAGNVQEMAMYTRPLGFAPEDITIPVRWFHGEDDTNVPLPIAKDLVARIPLAELTVLPGKGHMFTVERPDLLLDLVRS